MKLRKILLPQDISRRLDTLAELKEEVNGVLLFQLRDKGTHFEGVVHALQMTNLGEPQHVRADPIRMDIINKFLENNPTYNFVKFHTHSNGTGQQWFNKFSSGDLQSYAEQLSHDESFIGMMASPISKLLHSHADHPVSLHVIPNPVDFQAKNDFVSREMKKAAAHLGHSGLPMLEGTRRRQHR